MIFRTARLAMAAICAFVGAARPVAAADSRADLLFEINSALKARDRAALERCFNFDRVDAGARKTVGDAIGTMLAWPAHQVSTSERSGAGKARLTEGGRAATLNGEWTFQVHIHAGKPPSSGFVFPAGRAGTQWLILLTVPDAG